MRPKKSETLLMQTLHDSCESHANTSPPHLPPTSPPPSLLPSPLPSLPPSSHLPPSPLLRREWAEVLPWVPWSVAEEAQLAPRRRASLHRDGPREKRRRRGAATTRDGDGWSQNRPITNFPSDSQTLSKISSKGRDSHTSPSPGVALVS